MQGTWKTTGGGPDLSGLIPLAAAAAAAALAYAALQSAARTLGELIVIIPVAVLSLAAGWGGHMLTVHLRRGRAAPASPQQPEWIPVRRIGRYATVLERPAPPRAIAAPAPVHPQVVNNFFGNVDPAVVAAAVAGAQQQPQRVPLRVLPGTAEEVRRG